RDADGDVNPAAVLVQVATFVFFDDLRTGQSTLDALLQLRVELGRDDLVQIQAQELLFAVSEHDGEKAVYVDIAIPVRDENADLAMLDQGAVHALGTNQCLLRPVLAIDIQTRPGEMQR